MNRDIKKNQALMYRKVREGYYQDRERMEARGRQSSYSGIMDNPDYHARVTGENDETIEIFLRVQDQAIAEARFIAERCLVTRAVCSAAMQLVTGKTIDAVARIDTGMVADHLGGVPGDHEHCLDLVVTAIREALKHRGAGTA